MFFVSKVCFEINFYVLNLINFYPAVQKTFPKIKPSELNSNNANHAFDLSLL